MRNILEQRDIYISNEDNMKLMARYADNYFDLAIVDPPYGISQPAFRSESNNKKAKTRKYNNTVYQQKKPTDDYFNELIRVSRNQIIWGGNYFTKHLTDSTQWVFWDKCTELTQWGDGELAYTSFNGAIKKYTFAWNGMLQGNMKNKEARIHPTQKPIALYKWLLQNYAKPGYKILDTHLGSGSIAIACYDLKFSLTACEIDIDYYNDAIRRIKEHTNQLELFN